MKHDRGSLMKILIVTEGFFPGKKYGGPPVSTYNFCALMAECGCYIIARDHDLGERTRYEGITEGWNDRGHCKVLYLGDEAYGAASFERAVGEIEPDIIYLQSLFQACVLPCLRIAKKYGIKVLLAPRGELCAGAFRKKYKKIPYILALRWMGLLKDVFFQSTSDEETQAIKKYLGAEPRKIACLTNIPSIPGRDFGYPEKKAGEAKLVFLSRIHPKKNLIQAIRCLKNVAGNVAFDIYGPLEDPRYWELCQKEIAALPDNVKAEYRGLVGHDAVHETFSRYDAFLFPTFSENYGHVIIEALASGCPVIVSDRTPWDDLQEAGAGYVCALEDGAAFENAVQRVIDASGSAGRSAARRYAQKRMDLDTLREAYGRFLDSMVDAASKV